MCVGKLWEFPVILILRLYYYLLSCFPSRHEVVCKSVEVQDGVGEY